MSETPLERLQEAIQTELERDPKGPRVAALLREYAAGQDDWRAFARFDPDAYARNLVYRSDEYEMMVVCWGEGQESPIHNHAGQNCWMTILEGEIEEQHYAQPADGHVGALSEGRKCLFRRGEVAFINDEIALHKVRPAPGLRGVSMHLYAKPIEVCNVYDPETCRVERRQLAFHSVAGATAS